MDEGTEPGEVKHLAQGHSVYKRQSQNLNPGVQASNLALHRVSLIECVRQ